MAGELFFFIVFSREELTQVKVEMPLCLAVSLTAFSSTVLTYTLDDQPGHLPSQAICSWVTLDNP